MEQKTMETILKVVAEERPKDVADLIELLKSRLSLSESELVDRILRLQAEGKIVLREHFDSVPRNLTSYLRSKFAIEYWITIIWVVSTAVAFSLVQANDLPLAYVRNVFGTIFVAFLPGYSLMKALFPTTPPLKTPSAALDRLEAIVIGIGLSIALVPIVGLVMNSLPWGLNPVTSLSSLTILTVAASSLAVIRQYRTRTQNIE